jgi:hypothetical protein
LILPIKKSAAERPYKISLDLGRYYCPYEFLHVSLNYRRVSSDNGNNSDETPFSEEENKSE